jgi:hypothetical protein
MAQQGLPSDDRSTGWTVEDRCRAAAGRVSVLAVHNLAENGEVLRLHGHAAAQPGGSTSYPGVGGARVSAWEDRPRLAVEANAGPGDGQVVQLGSRVCIRDADGDAEFYVVPPEEADPVADRVSAHSPLGGALLGRHVGDVVRFRAPGGVLCVTVVSIR